MIEYTGIKEEDAEGLSILDKKVFSVPWSLKSFSDDAKNPMARYVIAKSDGKIIGYAAYWKVIDEGQITNICVDEKFRRQKIASEMVERLIKKATEDEIIKLSLEVRENNIAAISLYEKYGFVRVGKRNNYYKNPTEAAVLMDKTININPKAEA